MLGKKDDFLAALSPFDRAARLKTDQPVTQAEFVAFRVSQVQDWQEAEKESVTQIFDSIERKLGRLKISFPRTITMVKTSGREEGEAAYCRGLAIVLPEKKLRSARPVLENLLIHELFHVLSTEHPELRGDLYGIVGFQLCRGFAVAPALRERKITNPDAARNNVYIQVRHQKKPVIVAPVLYSRTPRYDVNQGGEFFSYLEFRLMVLEKTKGGFRPWLSQNRDPHLLEVREVEDFFTQVGQNTSYLIHPEEILAENFVLLTNGEAPVPSPQILKRLERMLFQQ